MVPGQPKKKVKLIDKKPIVFINLNSSRNGKNKPIMVRALLDSGGSGSLITEEYANKLRCKPSKNKTEWTTPSGTMTTKVRCKPTFSLPELYEAKHITFEMHVAPTLGNYDMILGRDFLRDMKIDLQFSTERVVWEHVSMPFKDTDSTILESYYVQDPTTMTEEAARIKGIMDAKYEPADIPQIVKDVKHLTTDEQDKFLKLLMKYETLFDGTLGNWKGTSYDIDLKPEVDPYHARSYPIPKVHYSALRLEVERLCEIGVLKRVNRSEWAAPTFIIPKKDGTVRFISDFRELNKRIKRRPYPIPKIQDMLMNLEGFQFATSLDLNMGYYHIELSPKSKELCTIVLPFGKYEYQKLPMGLCNSPDVFQEKMSELFLGWEFVRAYIDDILITSSSDLDDHLSKLDQVLHKLKEAGLKVNATKSSFVQHELEYLGYWITRTGISPVAEKVSAISNIAPPKTKKDLRKFIGIVNYYRDMWIRRSHVLAPLARLTSKTAKWSWGAVEQKAFDDIKRIISREALLTYPDFNETFVIHTDASHLQLGAVISQKGKPIAFYSRKLNSAQTRYTTTERELLSIVETLKEFRNILLGHRIVVHTDHKNLTCKNFNTERVMRWRLILEEYGPELLYIKGEDNIVADALSRMDLIDDTVHNEPTTGRLSNDVMSELYANDQALLADAYPLRNSNVHRLQLEDADLVRLSTQNTSGKYGTRILRESDEDLSLITYKDRICVPKKLQRITAEWYHGLLMHPGSSRTLATLQVYYYWKSMRTTVESVCNRCGACRETKPKTIKYGKLPKKPEPETIPWHTLCIDLIGPYTFGKNKYDKNKVLIELNEITLQCLTMIDPATGWFEIVQLPNKRADIVANLLEQTWLTRYPWPSEIVLDRGTEFMAEVINLIENEHGIVRKLITTRNPQANSMVERAHQTVHNMIRSKSISDRHDLDHEAFTGILSAVRFAMNSTIHTTSQATPGQLVFSRDMMHNIRFEADWQYIKSRKLHRIRQNNVNENKSRREHIYKVGDEALLLEDPSRKHGENRYSGPYAITAVHDNGTVTLQSSKPNGATVTQDWNIRQISPVRS